MRRTASLTLWMTLTACLALGCDQIGDFVDDNKSSLDIPINTDYEFLVPIDVGASMGPTAGQTSPADVSQTVAPPPTTVDLVEEVGALKDAKGRVKSFKISSVTVTPQTNTLTTNLPEISLVIGPQGASAIDQGQRVATIPSVAAGSTAAVSGIIDSAGQDAAQQWLTQLVFSQGTSMTLVVKKGQKVPSGRVDLKVKLALRVVLNPLK